MIIDFHTHTFPDRIAAATIQKLGQAAHIKAFSDGTASGLRASAKRAGIDLSVVLPVATSPRQVVTINDSSARINETTEETGLLSFGCIHPDYEDWHAELARVHSLGLKGIKIHPVYQRVDLDDIRYLRILERAGELGLVVVTHNGLDIGFPGEAQSSPEKLAKALTEVGPVTVIAAHMGGWKQWDEAAEQLASFPNLYVDTAFSTGRIVPLEADAYPEDFLPMLGKEAFLKQVQHFGAHRVVFGTDSPWSDQKETLDWIQALPMEAAQKDAILGGNAKRLLGI